MYSLILNVYLINSVVDTYYIWSHKMWSIQMGGVSLAIDYKCQLCFLFFLPAPTCPTHLLTPAPPPPFTLLIPSSPAATF